MARKKNGVVIPMPPGVTIHDLPVRPRSLAQSTTVLTLDGKPVACLDHYRDMVILDLRSDTICIDHDDIPLVLALLHRALPEAQ